MDIDYITPFRQHGFRETGESGFQVIGWCPFKQHKKPDFYINKQTGQWDCKACTISGNTSTFLKMIAEKCEVDFNPTELVKAKKLKAESFKKFHVGYNIITHNYTYPLFTIDGKIQDIRIYKIGDKTISTKGCQAGLRGWEDFGKPGTIWVTEGESDYFALHEVMGETDDVICSLPGAGTFKDTWAHLFRDRKVVLLLDNDDAGRKGAIRIYNKLSVLAQLSFIHWPADKKTGYDVRDLYIENPKGCLDFIKTHLHKYPPGVEKPKEVVEEKEEKVEVVKHRIPLSKIYDSYRKWLHITDENVLDIIFGAVIANRLPGDPLWLFLVAPPGGTKTEFLMPLSECERIMTVTSLTPATLISGMNAGGNLDPSLIPQLNHKVLVVKDFTAILNLPVLVREEIFGILRDAYDGECGKPFGNGVVRRYKSKFGIIAGVTPAIDFHIDGNVVLGERFLMYRIRMPGTSQERRKMVLRALANVTHEDVMRNELRTVAKNVLGYDYTKLPLPKINPAMLEKFVSLSQFSAVMRAVVIRDRYTREITHKPFIEISTRLSKQFLKFAMGIAYFRGESRITDYHYNILKNVARGTVPHKMEDSFRKIYKELKETFTIQQVTDLIGLPSSTCMKLIEDFRQLKVLTGTKISTIQTIYKINEDFRHVVEGAEIYA